MDTWATSSLTPQIATRWVEDPDLFARTFPMDMRPQAHDIIRTWLFYTVVRSHYEHDAIPWANAAISGFIVDPDRKKLSKSAANAPDDPAELIARYGADGVRYWAANGRPGMDVVFDEGQLKIGRKLAIKLLNASKFALGLGSTTGGEVTEPLDRSMLAALADLVAEATAAFDRYDYARAIERTEGFFWSFCDDYLELVKNRAYGADGDAGRRRPARRWAWPCARCSGCSRRSSRSSPRRSGRGGRRARSTGRRGPRPTPSARPRAPTTPPRPATSPTRRPGRRRRRARRGPQGQERGQAIDAHRGHVGGRHRHARAAGAVGAGRGRRPLGGAHRHAHDGPGRAVLRHGRARPRGVRGVSGRAEDRRAP